jgi:RNA polymerase II-associated protein 3
MANAYEKNLVEMQYKLKENQSQMADCFKELDSWSKDMKIKEKSVLQGETAFLRTKKENKDYLPPIRSLNTTSKKKKKKKETTSTSNGEKNKKINSYDYRSWDKLDVDKLCDEIDEEKSNSSDYETDEEWEEEQRKIKANWEKERGNEFFKNKLYDEAISCYTNAMNLDPVNAVYAANRAMCLLNQEKYAAAEVDCTLSIALDPSYAKAYHRRGTANEKLGKLKEAKRDYESLLKLDSNSKLAQESLNRIEQLINNGQLVFPIIKTEANRSKKPLKRIQISEINSEAQRKNQQPPKLEIIKTQPQVNVTIPDAPNNAYQFRKDWQSLRNNSQHLATYFKVNFIEFYHQIGNSFIFFVY